MNIDAEYDFVIANQILHHVVALEGLFDNVSRILGRDGLLMTRDMIGKNGHQAWPEALEIIDSIWADMPDRYKHNHRDGQHYERFPNRDFSVDCFEGIRSRDVLANITSHFEFKAFYAYGGIFERFVNRGWGHNYSFDNKEDERFMTHLQNLNDELLDNGKITPTQMAGYFQRSFKNGRYWKSRTPSACIRPE